ncbi:16S rRNA (guanine(527)-N(7))-methyltransferase RsmG [Frigidibacter albus]|uniref:Ribosomal RNA small subunit methyltransferase G n=1 Tax=Frigidibacter albus TaxID=1465486 RepID=A0A6L8VJ15_9RHOB|nr:16S rRNA (guanine(527)-N(7))-methyltransferase RsmG [Frigidibacter albus]MZQ89552.1 16S rRNA (guanine(527)-N(7))-methyltransferase RsmG [Frigidibacter albus]NBE31458.1 16S rRNA (guanine(527)-N(7))-methyltransferase RsmG [Frigidibacter albus]GGH55362.1 ribosomal RNA small subunit methyltransferase G [Frigidibacter albus]
MTDDLGLNVSRETSERLATYAELLVKWNPAINLVSKSSLADLQTRHFADSAQLLALCPPDARRWADLGSGGGFPGLVIAILAAESMPDLAVTLVESDGRKAAFLSAVVRETGLRTSVVADRIESLPPLAADVLSARALAPLSQLLAFAEQHLAPNGRALFPKGATHRSEVAESLADWRFDLREHPSKTDPQAVILEIEGVSRV